MWIFKYLRISRPIEFISVLLKGHLYILPVLGEAQTHTTKGALDKFSLPFSHSKSCLFHMTLFPPNEPQMPQSITDQSHCTCDSDSVPFKMETYELSKQVTCPHIPTHNAGIGQQYCPTHLQSRAVTSP